MYELGIQNLLEFILRLFNWFMVENRIRILIVKKNYSEGRKTLGKQWLCNQIVKKSLKSSNITPGPIYKYILLLTTQSVTNSNSLDTQREWSYKIYIF